MTPLAEERSALDQRRQPNGARRFLCVTTVDAIGSGLMLPMSALFFTRAVGLAAVSVGIGLSIAGVIGLVAAPLTGPLVERYSARGLLTGCYVASAIAYALYPLARSYTAFLAVVSLAAVSNRITQPARAAFARLIAGSNQASVGLLAKIATVRNAGFAIGGLLTSGVLAIGRHEGYVAIALANAASYLIVAIGMRGLGGQQGARTPAAGGGSRQVYGELLRKHRDYLALAALNSVLLLYDSVLVVGVPLWLTEQTQAPIWLAGVLFTLNTVIVVGLQIRVGRSVADAYGAARAYARSGAMALTACIAFATAGGAAVGLAVVLLTLGAVALTAGELCVSAAEWGASIALAPDANRGYFLGIFGTGTAAQFALGPALVTFCVVELGRAGWLLLGLLMLASGLAAKRIARARAQALEDSLEDSCGERSSIKR